MHQSTSNIGLVHSSASISTLSHPPTPSMHLVEATIISESFAQKQEGQSILPSMATIKATRKSILGKQIVHRRDHLLQTEVSNSKNIRPAADKAASSFEDYIGGLLKERRSAKMKTKLEKRESCQQA